MTIEKIEKRNYDIALSEVNETSEGLFVRGLVNRTGEWSQPLPDRNGKPFIERIMPKAFTNAISRGGNIKFLANHDKDKLLASTKNGTLKLEETDEGLVMEAQIAPTAYGKDIHKLIEVGEMAHMSFGMAVLKDVWENVGGTMRRSITDLFLTEVSVLADPAYEQSSISVRSNEPNKHVEIPQIEERNFSVMSIKQLEERKQELLEEAEQIDKQIKTENRSKEVSEELREAMILDEIKQINKQIDIENKKIEKREVIVMENTFTQEQEIRGVDQFIRKQEGEEVRSLTAGTGAGALTVPTSLHNQIVEKLYEVAPLFAMSKSFTPVNGYLEILREQSLGGSTAVKFVDEMSTVGSVDFTMDKVKLEQRRVATSIELSQHLINDSGIDVVNYATNLLARRVGLTLDRTVLNGDKTLNQFEGVLNSVAIENIPAVSATGITIDELQKVFLTMHPDYVKNAVWVMSRGTLMTIAKIKDGNGQYFLVHDVAETGVTYKLFGRPVVINDAMPDIATGARSVLFGNFQEGYATMTKKGLELKKIDNDVTQASKGATLLILDGYMDGKIYNENAFKFLKQA